MLRIKQKFRKSISFRGIVAVILAAFLCQSFVFAPAVSAQVMPVPFAGAGVAAPLIKGLQIYPDQPLKFDFILDTGNSGVPNDPERRVEGSIFKMEADKLIRYFLASLTIPENDMWVNLNPNEPDRIVPQSFGQTQMGRDLLAQDYILKQITSSLMNPEKESGRKFWDKIYQQIYEKYGNTDVPVDILNRVWIVPDKAVVYEHGDRAFVVDASLKVMLDKEYFKQTKDRASAESTPLADDQRSLIKSIILPAIEKEVNSGQTFAQLRQIYHAMILATWFKRSLKESLLGQVYADKKKTGGISLSGTGKDSPEAVYQQYLDAFKDGAFQYIKEEYDPLTRTLIPRKYFSGGITSLKSEQLQTVSELSESQISDFAMLAGDLKKVTVNLKASDATSDPVLDGYIEHIAYIGADFFDIRNALNLIEDIQNAGQISERRFDFAVRMLGNFLDNPKELFNTERRPGKQLLEKMQEILRYKEEFLQYAAARHILNIDPQDPDFHLKIAEYLSFLNRKFDDPFLRNRASDILKRIGYMFGLSQETVEHILEKTVFIRVDAEPDKEIVSLGPKRVWVINEKGEVSVEIKSGPFQDQSALKMYSMFRKNQRSAAVEFSAAISMAKEIIEGELKTPSAGVSFANIILVNKRITDFTDIDTVLTAELAHNIHFYLSRIATGSTDIMDPVVMEAFDTLFRRVIDGKDTFSVNNVKIGRVLYNWAVGLSEKEVREKLLAAGYEEKDLEGLLFAHLIGKDREFILKRIYAALQDEDLARRIAADRHVIGHQLSAYLVEEMIRLAGSPQRAAVALGMMFDRNVKQWNRDFRVFMREFQDVLAERQADINRVISSRYGLKTVETDLSPEDQAMTAELVDQIAGGDYTVHNVFDLDQFLRSTGRNRSDDNLLKALKAKKPKDSVPVEGSVVDTISGKDFNFRIRGFRYVDSYQFLIDVIDVETDTKIAQNDFIARPKDGLITISNATTLPAQYHKIDNLDQGWRNRNLKTPKSQRLYGKLVKYFNHPFVVKSDFKDGGKEGVWHLEKLLMEITMSIAKELGIKRMRIIDSGAQKAYSGYVDAKITQGPPEVFIDFQNLKGARKRNVIVSRTTKSGRKELIVAKGSSIVKDSVPSVHEILYDVTIETEEREIKRNIKDITKFYEQVCKEVKRVLDALNAERDMNVEIKDMSSLLRNAVLALLDKNNEKAVVLSDEEKPRVNFKIVSLDNFLWFQVFNNASGLSLDDRNLIESGGIVDIKKAHSEDFYSILPNLFGVFDQGPQNTDKIDWGEYKNSLPEGSTLVARNVYDQNKETKGSLISVVVPMDKSMKADLPSSDQAMTAEEFKDNVITLWKALESSGAEKEFMDRKISEFNASSDGFAIYGQVKDLQQLNRRYRNKIYKVMNSLEISGSTFEKAHIQYASITYSLLENLEQHGSEDGMLITRIDVENKKLYIAVLDHGPGFPVDFQGIPIIQTDSEGSFAQRSGSLGMGWSLGDAFEYSDYLEIMTKGYKAEDQGKKFALTKDSRIQDIPGVFVYAEIDFFDSQITNTGADLKQVVDEEEIEVIHLLLEYKDYEQLKGLAQEQKHILRYMIDNKKASPEDLQILENILSGKPLDSAMTASDNFVTPKTTAANRNRDVFKLLISERFEDITGIDISKGKKKIVDIGVGNVPVSTIEMGEYVWSINPKIQVIGTELPHALAKTHIVFKGGDFFEKMKNEIMNSAWYLFGRQMMPQEHILEIIFSVTGAGSREFLGISEIVAKIQERDGTISYQEIGSAPNVPFVQQGVLLNKEAKLMPGKFFQKLFTIVGGEHLAFLLGSSRWNPERFFKMEIESPVIVVDKKNEEIVEQSGSQEARVQISSLEKSSDADVIVRQNPLRKDLADKGITLVDQGNWSGTKADKADIMTANFVVTHIPQENRMNFIHEKGKYLKPGGVLILKNMSRKSKRLFQIDVYQKEKTGMLYLGSLITDDLNKSILGSKAFEAYSRAHNRKNLFGAEELKYFFKPGTDEAMATDLGGIDLNPQKLEIQREGGGVRFNNFSADNFRNVSGFVPVIINILPVADVYQMLGISSSSPKENYS